MLWFAEVMTFSPSSATVCRTPSKPRQSDSTFKMTRWVASPLVPSGVWITTMRYPWSSVGTNDLGRVVSIHPVRASRRTEGATIVHQ